MRLLKQRFLQTMLKDYGADRGMIMELSGLAEKFDIVSDTEGSDVKEEPKSVKGKGQVPEFWLAWLMIHGAWWRMIPALPHKRFERSVKSTCQACWIMFIRCCYVYRSSSGRQDTVEQCRGPESSLALRKGSEFFLVVQAHHFV